ncbi:MAG: dihydrofolate reductase [Chloroflexi bacterium]|nr:dihydrofolate reductase [Chloroflexota bacterium]
MNKATISLIVAMDHNRLIGANNGLPWRLPDDMKWFVEKTMGKPVIMGRKTYDSVPQKFKPLHGRQNIIITRSQNYQAPGCTVVHSLADALMAAGKAPEIIIGGGAQVYAQALPIANRLYLTLVESEFTGDVYSTLSEIRNQTEFTGLTGLFHPVNPVKKVVSDNVYFPDLDLTQWQETFRQVHEADEWHVHPFTWFILERRSGYNG